MSLSTDLLRILKEDQRNSFAQIITGDESWFYFDYIHQLVWVPSRDEIPERIKQKIEMKNCLILVIWSVNRIHNLLDMSKKTIYKSTFFYDVVVPDLLENIHRHSRRQTLTGVLVHPDNAHPHNSKKSHECLTKFHTRRVSHLAYSPDRAPSDFFLFGTVKTELQNYEIHRRQDLIMAIREIFDEMPKETFSPASISWIKRLKLLIQNKGKYFSK
jgi:hypothetical protein